MTTPTPPFLPNLWHTPAQPVPADPEKGPTMSETQVTSWQELPHGVYEGANRYSTDDEEVLTLWRKGETFDVRLRRDVERIKAEALEQLLCEFSASAVSTGARLSDYYDEFTEDQKAAFMRAFEVVMLAAEPGRAEYKAAEERRRGD